MKKTCLAAALSLGIALSGAAQADAAVKVRVQPSGSTIPEAYAITGETRTYFGNVSDCPGTCEYKWEFSDGSSTAWANVTNTRFISTTKSFAGSGLNWARLTVRDTANTADTNTATIETQTLSVDTDTRKKNSAVDKGLRWQYQNEVIDASGSHWGASTGYHIGATSMALIAFENHRHNLDSSNDDIYKASVEGGLKWLFNHAYDVDLSTQACIGDPEGTPGDAASDDGDSDNDGKGITFNTQGSGNSTWDEGYEMPMAMLAIVNSCEKATAQATTVTSTSSAFVNGLTLWDAMVDAKDFIAFAQTDNQGGGGGGYYSTCSDNQNGIEAYTQGYDDGDSYSFYTQTSLDGTDAACYGNTGNEYFSFSQSGDSVGFYSYYYPVPDCSTFAMRVDPGDGSGMITIPHDNCSNGWYGYPNGSVYYTYTTPGTYTPTAEYTTDGGQTWTTICDTNQSVTIGTSLDCQSLTFEFDFGDGTTAMVAPDYCDASYAYANYYNHSYSASGTYTPHANYSNDGGTTWTTGCDLDPIIVATQTGGTCSDQGEGWRYVRNDNSVDNSVSQWPVLALAEAKDRWDININPKAIEAFKPWLAYSQGSTSGGFAYDSPGSWENFAKTGAGLVMLKWTGNPVSATSVQKALTFLDNNWSVNNQNYANNTEDFYAMYAFYKGMKIFNLATLGTRVWEDIYRDWLIASQQADGRWTNGWSLSMPSPDISTATGIAMLAPAIGGLPPVAEAGGPYGPANAGQNITLDGSGSYHQDNTKALVKYEWDFDSSNGLWWTSNATPPAGEGAVAISPTTSYPDTGANHVYTVSLRVTDNGTPVMTSTDTATVSIQSGNVAPVAMTNGPWSALPGTDVIFDGSTSFDPNSCTTVGDPSCLGDSIVSYEWDLDGDGAFNEGNGDDGIAVTGNLSKVKKAYTNPISQTVTLRVTDSYGLTAQTTPQLNIVSIALTYASDYNYCFQESINRNQIRQGVTVQFSNLGNATAENVVVTVTQVPTNLTLLKGTSNLGNLTSGAMATTQCNATTKVADIEVRLDRRVRPVKDWLWKAEFDLNGTHYIIDNLPPLAP